ncbi:hypothetical protein OG607_05915 [Streptomyces sp. NBC_01537]
MADEPQARQPVQEVGFQIAGRLTGVVAADDQDFRPWQGPGA